MKTKLLTLFLIGCFLLIGLAVFTTSNSISEINNDIAFADSGISEKKFTQPAKNKKAVTSFFEIFTDQESNSVDDPDLNIENVGGGYKTEAQNGIKTFLRCTGDLSNNGFFNFIDPDQSSYPTGTTYFIDWGDGDTSTTVEPHTYTSGLYTMSYTIISIDGTSETSEFRVFVGTNPPPISVDLIDGNDNCLPNEYTFEITVNNNTPGTTYTITINDGSPDIVLESSDYPIGGSFTETFNHEFLGTSCGVNSTVNGSPSPNSFSVTARATNPCETDGSFISTGPIRVSEPTEADFVLPADIACVNSLVNFTDESFGGENVSSSGCNADYGRYWEVTRNGDRTIDGGQLGSDNGNTTDWFSWTDGSEILGVKFEKPGDYEITLVTRNNCGESRITKEICIIPEFDSEFTLSKTEACYEDDLIITTTNESFAEGCDITPIYEWEVTRINDECSTSTPGWEFTNSTGSNSVTPQFLFTSPGIYEVNLRVYAEDILPGNGCQDDVETVIVTIKDKPKAEVPDLIVCQDESFQIDPTVNDCYTTIGTTYSWDFSSSSAASIAGSNDPNPSISYDTPGIYNYTLTVTNDCGPTTKTGTIEVLPPVYIEANGPTEVCVDGEILLNGTISGGTGIGNWTAGVDGGTFSPDASALDPTYTPPTGYVGDITFTLTPDNSGTLCSEPIDTHTVTISPGPEVDAGSYEPICVNSSINLNGSFGGTASNITWTSSVGGTFTDPTNPNTEFTPPVGFTGTITLTITTDDPLGSCEANSDTVDLEVLPLGEVDPLPDLEFCNTEEVSEIIFSSPNTSNTTNFEWEIDTNIGLTPLSGTGNLPSFTAENLTEFPIIATVTVTPFVNSGSTSCEGVSETFTITINPAPIIIDTTIDLCNGNVFDYTPTSGGGNFVPAGTTYIWNNPVSNPPGAIVGGFAETTPQTSIAQPIENLTTNAASLVYTVTPILDGCEGKPFTLTVNFDDEPVIQDITLEVCSDESLSIVPDENFSGNQIPLGTTYKWDLPVVNPAGSITGATAESIPTTSIDQQLTNISSETATVTYTITPDVDGCEGEPFTLTLVVKPEPFVGDNSINICSGENFNITPEDILPNRVPAGTLYTWDVPTVSIPGTISGITDGTPPQSEVSQTLVSNSSEEVVVTYEVTPEHDGCFGEPFLIEVTVEPKPFIEDITENICTGGTFSVLPDNSGSNTVPVNTTYTWTEPVSVPAGAITGGAAETTPQTEISQNVTNTSENIATLTYTVTPRSGNCVGDPFTVEVIVESSGLIQEEPQSFQTICEGGQISPLGVSLESGESTSTTYQWFRNTTPTNAGGTEIPGATDATYLPPAFDIPGTYFFYVVVSPEGDQCGDVISQVSEVEVIEDPVIDVQPLDNQELCLDAPANELNVEVSGGVGQFNYQWYVNTTADTTTGTEIPDETNSSFTPPTDQEGILFYYVVISQEAAGCETVSVPARIRVEPQPVINQQPQSEELCLNATPNLLSVNLNFSLGTPTYQWFENDESSNTGGTAIAGANQPTFLPATDVAGEQFYYAVVSFDNSSCGPVVSDPATLTVVPFAEINPVEDIEVCRGDEISGINFSTTAPTMITSYEWTNSNPEIGLAANGAGNIPVFTATNTTGVTQTAVVTVTSESSFSGDPCGQSTIEFTITVPSEVIDNAVISDYNGNQTSCADANDGSIQISPDGGILISNTQSYIFNWSGPDGFSSNQEDIFNLKQGIYTLEITDGFGCVNEFNYAIEAPDELIVTEDAALNIQCHGEFTGKILISLTGGTGSYSYSWLKDGMLVATTQDLENIGAGYYTIIATDQNNCSVTEGFEITEPDPISIEVLEKTAIVCTDEISIPKNETSKAVGDEFNGFINISVEGGTPLQTGPNEFTYQYEWKNAVNQVISTEKNLTGVGPGSYSVDVYDNLSCIASKDVELIMPDPIKIEVSSQDETCAFGEDGQISLNIEGGTAPYNVEWSNGATGKELSQLPPGAYTANITDKYNCEISIDVEIEGVDALAMNHTFENISCFGAKDGFVDVVIEGGRLLPNGSYDYQWSGPNGFTSSEPSLSNLDEGVYSLVVTDASNCTVNLDVEINEPTQLQVGFRTTQANCFGIDDGTITLFIEGGIPPYTSNFGSVGSDNSTFLFDQLAPGTYDIEVMDDNGCMEILEIEIEQDFINEIDPPTGEAYQEFCIEDQPSLSDLNVSGMDIKWYLSPADEIALAPDYLIAESTILYARNFDADLNCLSSNVLEVEVNIIEGIIDVNNFITVNGNGLNEKLNVINIESFPENEMKIYNRYGKLVWETTSYNNTDNTFRGASNVGGTLGQSNFLPTGTYFYILNYKSPCKNDTKKGFVQIDNNNR